MDAGQPDGSLLYGLLSDFFGRLFKSFWSYGSGWLAITLYGWVTAECVVDSVPICVDGLVDGWMSVRL